MKDKVPAFTSDEEAAAFLDRDLTQLDFKQFQLVTFEFSRKSAQLGMTLPLRLLDVVKQRTRVKSIFLTRYVRRFMEALREQSAEALTTTHHLSSLRRHKLESRPSSEWPSTAFCSG